MGLFGFLKKDNKKDEAERRASAIEPKTSKLDNDLRETAENFSKTLPALHCDHMTAYHNLSPIAE